MKRYIITRTFDHLNPILKQGTLVTNVRLLKDGMFRFLRLDTNTETALYYGWAFADDTKKNRKLLKQRGKIERKMEKLQQKRNKVWQQITTLDKKR